MGSKHTNASERLTQPDLPRPADETWSTYLDEWDRSLRAANKPMTTRYNYELAVTQFADYLGRLGADDLAAIGEDAADAIEEPTATERGHVELFIGWMIETRSASTATNKFKCLQQFYGYLVDEDEMTRSPLDRMSQPKVTRKLIPTVDDDAVKRLLGTCAGKSFLDLRDAAIIRLLFDTGGRLTEVARLLDEQLDLKSDAVMLRGKGDKHRVVPFGTKTGRALSRYRRARTKHAGAELPELWLSDRGPRPLQPNGIKIMLRRRGEQAGIENMHAHRFRHTLSHEWQVRGGNESALMKIMGWSSSEMLRRYGESAAEARAQQAARDMSLGDRL